MQHAYIYQTKLGKIMITEDGIGITGLSVLREDVSISDLKLNETELIRETADQLEEYLSGSRKDFNVKLNPKGTAFQRKVWKALQDIPYGETRSYKQIAEAVGNEKACRAVGMANHANPIMIIIPCHRVIGANGKLVGYGGGLELKSRLLELEQILPVVAE